MSQIADSTNKLDSHSKKGELMSGGASKSSLLKKFNRKEILLLGKEARLSFFILICISVVHIPSTAKLSAYTI